ncbi:MAG: hypothetical protein NBV68_04920 [Erythrobacter sp.]|uniref:hypothetical protein n=1 Tax=Erythrobacter sp. TaxID=1042 RepID=UPI0025DA261B|nr:hypothetical protein [Erythrobacter sp.]MCL9998699.1 hypothetical protein [Erythrobacter sp.]
MTKGVSDSLDLSLNEQSGVWNFAHRYTSLITFWNHAEMCGRQIAQLLLGESTMSVALTSELGNRTLMDAIEVASHELDVLGEHLLHFSKGFRVILGYRNFYVHSLVATEHNGLVPGDWQGVLFSLDGKGRARFFNRKLTSQELEVVISEIHKLIAYGAAIQKALGASGDGIDRLVQIYGSSLDMPIWPRCVEKTALYLQGQEPTPKIKRRGRTRGKAEKL